MWQNTVICQNYYTNNLFLFLVPRSYFLICSFRLLFIIHLFLNNTSWFVRFHSLLSRSYLLISMSFVSSRWLLRFRCFSFLLSSSFLFVSVFLFQSAAFFSFSLFISQARSSSFVHSLSLSFLLSRLLFIASFFSSVRSY